MKFLIEFGKRDSPTRNVSDAILQCRSVLKLDQNRETPHKLYIYIYTGQLRDKNMLNTFFLRLEVKNSLLNFGDDCAC